MRNDDGPGPFGKGFPDPVRIDIKRIRIDIDQTRRSARVSDGVEEGAADVAGHQDLVSGPDPQRQEPEMQRRGPRIDRHGAFDARSIRHFILK